MTTAELHRLRAIARRVLGRPARWALGLEVDDLVGVGWLAWSSSRSFERARYAMIDHLRVYYGMQRVVESHAAARREGRDRSARRVRWVSAPHWPWDTLVSTHGGELRRLEDVTAASPASASWSPSPEQLAAFHARAAGLPPRLRVVITALVVQGVEAATVARDLGCSVGAVHVAKSKALQQLRAA